jgi:hypothetical protein
LVYLFSFDRSVHLLILTRNAHTHIHTHTHTHTHTNTHVALRFASTSQSLLPSVMIPVAVGEKKHKLLWPPMICVSTKFGKKWSVVSEVGKVTTTKDFKEQKDSKDVYP